MEFDFYKYQALGNDYLVIDPNYFKISLSKNLIKKICDRNFGVGGDGILYGPFYRESKNPILKIFNPDGSEAEKSGNGIRIFAKYLFDQGYLKEDSFILETLGGKVMVSRNDSKAKNFTVSMGNLVFQSDLIPVRGPKREVINEKLKLDDKTLFINCASIGNPHCVIICDEISKDEVLKLGPKIERNNLFPKKINVEFVKILDRNRIQMEVWERGVGYTLACGTGSCAAAGVCYKLGLCNPKIKVIMPGGIIDIEISKDFQIKMTGDVFSVAHGYFSKEFLIPNY